MGATPGFVKSKTAKMHIAVGLLDGLLVSPTAAGTGVQVVGVLAFVVFTARNFNKHPKHLRKNISGINAVNLEHQISYSWFKSSATKQQMQFGLGVGIGVLLLLV